MRPSAVLIGLSLSALLQFRASIAPAANATAPEPELPTDVARELFDRGSEHFRRHEFDAAVTAFEAAFRVQPHPSTLFNLARAYAAAERPLDAVRALEQYLADAKSLPVHNLKAANELLLMQRRRLGTITFSSTESGASISIDGVPVGETPLPSAIPVIIGTHTVIARRDGFLPTTVTIRVAPLQELELGLTLVALPAVPAAPAVPTVPLVATPMRPLSGRVAPTRVVYSAPAASQHPNTLTRVGVGALVVGVASAAIGSYYALRARSSWSTRNEHCRAVCDDQAVEAWHDARRYAFIADATLALGLVSSAAGAYLLISERAAPSPAKAARLSATVTGDAWFVSVSGPL